MSKPTMATVKSFIKKNRANLLIKNISDFDGMCDCVMPSKDASFRQAKSDEYNSRNTLGIAGTWFVGSSSDHITPYEDNAFNGFKISNCCGSFYLAIPRQDV